MESNRNVFVKKNVVKDGHESHDKKQAICSKDVV